MNSTVKTWVHCSRQASVKTFRTVVETAKPVVRSGVRIVGRHPEATVGALAGYAVGKQLDRVPGMKYLSLGQAKYILGFLGGIYGYQMALQRRALDIRQDSPCQYRPYT